MKGYRNRQEGLSRDIWEIGRIIAWTNLIPHQKKGKNITPQSILALPWDIKETVKKKTKEEVKQMFEKWDKLQFNK